MKWSRAIALISAVIAAVSLAACDPGKAPSKPPAAEPAPPSDRIQVPDTVKQTLGLTFATVERRRVRETIRLTGRFELEPAARQEYRVPMGGRIDLAVVQYQPVKRGEVLFRFDCPGWRDLQREIEAEWSAVQLSETRIDAAGRRLELARKFERLHEAEELGSQGATSHIQSLRATVKLWAERHAALERLNREGGGQASQLATALSEWRGAEAKLAETLEEHARLLVGLELEVKNAEAERDVAKSRYRVALVRAASMLGHSVDSLEASNGDAVPWKKIGRIEVTASQGGIVESIDATPGQWVGDNGLVLRVVDPNRVRFRAIALQADLATIVGLDRGVLLPPSKIGTTEGVACKVRLGLEANPDQRTVELIATPERTDTWVRAGVSSLLELVLDETADPELAVPCESVVRDGMQRVLFRRNPRKPDEVIRIEADVGPTDGRWVVVRSGLREGDQVVRDGVYELKLSGGGKAVGGHFHPDGEFHTGKH